MAGIGSLEDNFAFQELSPDAKRIVVERMAPGALQALKPEVRDAVERRLGLAPIKAEPGYFERVGARIGAMPGRMLEGAKAIGRLMPGGTSATAEDVGTAFQVFAPAETLGAVVGEAVRPAIRRYAAAGGEFYPGGELGGPGPVAGMTPQQVEEAMVGATEAGVGLLQTPAPPFALTRGAARVAGKAARAAGAVPGVPKTAIGEAMDRARIAKGAEAVPDEPLIRAMQGAENPPARVANLNLDRISTTDDVKRLLAEVADANRPAIEEARRGKISLGDTVDLANDLGLTPEKLLQRRRGQAFNAEEAVAARQILAASAERTWHLAQLARDGSDEAVEVFAKSMARHIGLQKQVSGLTAEAGRALGSFRIMAEGGVARQRAMKAVVESLGGKERLTEEAIARLTAITPDSPTFFRDVNMFIRDFTKAKTSDKIFELWVNGLLSGPVTHAVNTTSNALVAMGRSAEKGVAGAIDFLRSKITRTPQERFVGEAAADVFGMFHGLPEGVRKGLSAFATELPTEGMSKLELAQRAAIKGMPGRLVRLPGRALMAEDELFKAIASQAELHAQAYRQAAREGLRGQQLVRRIAEIVSNPADELKEFARQEALYRTFQQDLGRVGNTLLKARRDIPGARVIAPFMKTPINIAKYGLERTPLNFLRIALQAKRGQLPGGKLSDELAKATLGSLIAATVAIGAHQGLVSGGGPSDKAEREALRVTGWQPYSVKVGDQWIQYGRLEPLAMIAGLTADYVELMDRVEGEDAANQIAMAIAQNLTNKTFLSGLSDFLGAARDPQRYGERWVQRLAGSAVPTGVAQIARAIDPTVRKPEGVAETLASRIPFLSEQIRPLRDIWGRPVVRINTTAERLVSPVQRSPVVKDAATDEVVRLKAAPGSPRRHLGDVKLSDDEYEHYVERSGSIAHGLVTRIVASPGYAGRSDDEQEEAIRRAFTEARKAARLETTPEVVKRIWQDMEMTRPEKEKMIRGLVGMRPR